MVSIGFGTINCFVFAGDWCTTQTTIIVGAFWSCALFYTTAMFLFCFIIGIHASGISIPQSPNFDVVMFKVICGLPLLPLITRQTINKPWYIDFARAESEAPINAFYFNFIQWSSNNCKVIHKFLLNFRGQLYEWKTETWACDHLKANNWSAENLKTLDLGEFASEPAIQSCGSGQWIPCFDSCQLTVIWMSVIMLNTDYRLPH